MVTDFNQALACVCSITAGWLSDRYNKRSLVVIITGPIAVAGFLMLILLPADRPWAKYGAVFMACSGLYASIPIWLTWVSQPLRTFIYNYYV